MKHPIASQWVVLAAFLVLHYLIFGQTFIGMISARIFRASVIASLPWTWISNPLTTLRMWYGGYQLGLWILPGKQKPLSYPEIQSLMQNFEQRDWNQSLS